MTIPDLGNQLGIYLGLSTDGALALGVLIITVFLFTVALLRSGGTHRVSLRPLVACNELKLAVSEAAESGQAIHLAAGTGTVGTSTTAETLAGVNAVAGVAWRAAVSRVPILITTPSPLVLPLLQSAAEQAYMLAGAPDEYRPNQVRFAGDDRNAYAVAVTDSLAHEHIGSSLLLGSFGDELLFIGERGHAAGVSQIAGTASIRALPYAITTADHALIGEEIFAASAYLRQCHGHVASLLAQDWLRLLTVGVIIVGVLARTMGW